MAKKKKKNKNKIMDMTEQSLSESIAVSDSAEAACDGGAEQDPYYAAELKAREAFESLDEDERAELIAAPAVDIPYDPDFTEADAEEAVRALGADDIPVGDDEKESASIGKKRRKKQSLLANAVQFSILAVCAAAAVFCIVLLVENIKGKMLGEQIYADVDFDRFVLDDSQRDSFNHPSALPMLSSDAPMLSLYDRIAQGKSADSDKTDNPYAEKLNEMRASLTALKAKNKDVYGWIFVENTNIDHPVMRGSDNDYYLDHAFSGESLPIGSIFLDYNTADKLTDNYNAVLYGHNVQDVAGSKSSMFHDVTKFLNEDFFAENKIYIYTMDGVYIYKAVSIYPTTDEFFYYRCEFPSDETFLDFANEVVKRSKVSGGETFSAGDRMITLSTCTNGAHNGRYALHAKLVDMIQ